MVADGLHVFGRLKPGVSLAQAQAAVVLQGPSDWLKAYPEQNRGLEQTELLPLDGEFRGAALMQAISVFAGFANRNRRAGVVDCFAPMSPICCWRAPH